MQLVPRPTGPRRATDVADALRGAASAHGHRPALTVVTLDPTSGRPRREEQGYASLAQWAAKGAHLLELDLFAEPGDTVLLAGPPGWLPGAVALAAWWAGLAVTDDPSAGVLAAVVHESVADDDLPPALGPDEVLRWGDAADGGPATAVRGQAWAEAVQTFPDDPPPPRADGALDALPGRTQAAVLAAVHAAAVADGGGTAGLRVDGATRPELWLPAVLRALLTGRPTVLVSAGVPDEAVAGERITVWLDAPSPD